MRLQGAVFDGAELLTDGAGAWKSGVEEALTLLKIEWVWMYLVTELERHQAQELLVPETLGKYLRGVVSAQETGTDRTDPVLYDKAIRRLRSVRDTAVVFTGRMETLRRLKEAGLQVVAVTEEMTDADAREAQDLANQCVKDLTEFTRRQAK